MNRMVIISVFAAMAAMLPAHGGPYDRTLRRNLWNDGRNAAGIREDSVSVSYAEIGAEAAHGGFRDFSQAASEWSAGAVAATLVHWDRISLAGDFSFSHTSMREACGSMFIWPDSYPVDAIEFTPGRKDLQRYGISGSMAAELNNRWRAGVGAGFASANYAKRKDLRHTNYRLDFSFTPGVMYHSGKTALGAVYILMKNSESVDAEQIGSSESSYYAFLDKGLMYGAYEIWSGSGTHLDEPGIDGLPMREMSHGAAVQISHGGFYADVEYLFSRGVAGEKRTEWFRFPSHGITVRSGLRMERGGRMHFLRASLSWKRLRNSETVLGTEIRNGVTETVIYGQNTIFERRELCFGPEYEIVGGRGELRIGASVEIVERTVSQMYPYLVSDRIVRGGVQAGGRIELGRMFELSGSIGFMSANSSERHRSVDDNITASGEPFRLEEYYARQQEYLTASRAELRAGLRCNLKYGLYVEADVIYTHGFGLRFTDGNFRMGEMLKLGYNF